MTTNLSLSSADRDFFKTVAQAAFTNPFNQTRIQLDRYCSLLYQRFGTYEEVARRTGLDRRTVKKYVQFEPGNDGRRE